MNKKIPMRQCVGCGKMREKKELFRILKTDTDEIVLDVTGKKNGRGAYICKNGACFLNAKKTKALERSFKRPISPEIYDNLLKEFEKENE